MGKASSQNRKPEGTQAMAGPEGSQAEKPHKAENICLGCFIPGQPPRSKCVRATGGARDPGPYPLQENFALP